MRLAFGAQVDLAGRRRRPRVPSCRRNSAAGAFIILAQGEALGNGEGMPPSKERRRRGIKLVLNPLIPYIIFVIIDAIACEQLSVFILERDPFMVLFLIIDVTHQLFEMAGADGKRAITALPREGRKTRILCLQPFR